METSYRELDYESGNAIQTLRRRIGVTQAGLAEHLGVSVRTVKEWEGGGSYLKVERLKALIVLAVQSKAFPKGCEAAEIRELWTTTRQKRLLDEDWLGALLSAPPSPQEQSHECLSSHVALPHDVDPRRDSGSPLSASPPPPRRESGLPLSAYAPSPLTSQQGRPSAQPFQNRARMLRRLGHSYRELMNQSLQGAAWVELGLTHKPDAVQNAANLFWRVKRGAEQHLPAGTSIQEAYDEAGHELLILGEPGAGKSTLLLDLAQELILRAEQDETHPLPVILPLSSWALKRLPLQDWIAEQISEIYDVPRKLSAQWVREDALLPLLDGLDEMAQDHRPACITAINAYHSSHLVPLVVCSRRAEYETAAQPKRLALQSAVVVQPLAPTQVENYLVQIGEPLAPLHTTLQEHPALQELVTTPLMLNVLILTYRETSVDHLPDTQASLQEQVWADYVARMVEHKGDAKRYPHTRTVSHLCWLAQHMQARNQTVFYLEHLQPDWLDTTQQRTYRWWAVRLLGILIGVLVNFLAMTIAPIINKYDLMHYFQYIVIGVLLGALYTSDGEAATVEVGETQSVGTGPDSGQPYPAQEIAPTAQDQKKPGHRWGKHIAISLFIGLLFACSFGLDFVDQGSPRDWFHDSIVWFVSFAPDAFLLEYLLKKRSLVHGSVPLNSHAGRWKRLVHFLQTVYVKRFLIVATVIGLSYGLGYGLTVGLNYGYGLNYGLSYGLGDGSTFGAIFGLSSVLVGFILREQAGSVLLTERLRWTWRSLSRSLLLSKHFHVIWPLTSVIFLLLGLSYCASSTLSKGLAFGLRYGLGVGLCFGLGAGLIYWLLSGLLQGIVQERIEDQDRRLPNEGIQRSLRNSIIAGIVSGGISGIIVLLTMVSVGTLSNGLAYMLSNELSNALSHGLSQGLSVGLEDGPKAGLSGGLLVFITMGGLAVLRHYIIRFLLWRSRTFPMRAPHFLDDASARFLLRRVGGGYSFTHRMLLDYFAAGAKRTML